MSGLFPQVYNTDGAKINKLITVFALIFCTLDNTAYNLRRIGNILTLNGLKEYRRMLISDFSSKIHLSRRIYSLFNEFFFRILKPDE